jgi:hypothetical protein
MRSTVYQEELSVCKEERRTLMNHRMLSRAHRLLVGSLALVVLLLLAACGSVAGTGTGAGTASTITGSIVSVNANQHSAVVNVNGQQVTVTGLTDQQVAVLQTQVGKIYTLPITGSGNTVTISATATIEPAQTTPTGTQVTPTTAPATPSSTSATVFAPGSIQFIGTARTVSPSSITVSMPNGTTLSMSITALTDRSHYGGGLPPVGQLTKVETTANQDGSFTATKLEPADPKDVVQQNVVEYKGVTSSAVGPDRVIHFTVGTKPYTFTIGPTADLSDVGGNAQAIGASQLVKVKVQFAGAAGTVLKVERSH